ncbi:MAG TPA: 5'/3'-nucleotidase SurE [Alphaproteobacteria bacterium]|nr:5'/3'-nucleotidase SurE [Alphaproteobacteria bacterium]
MFEAPLDLAKARILVTNDDGIQAPGIKVLEAIARDLSKDVWVVAPETEQSAASHSLTLRRPLRIRQVAPRRFAVDGTPTDCVLLAINHILKARKPTLCLSGVNRGGNLGEDVTYSGTVAAAMEATLLGVPSVAMSQVYADRAKVPWDTARLHAPAVLRKLAKVEWPRSVLMNINFPDCAPEAVRGSAAVGQGRHKIGDQLVETSDPRGEPYYWIGAMRLEDPTSKGTDIAVIKENKISVTPLFMDLTHRATMRKLSSVFR